MENGNTRQVVLFVDDEPRILNAIRRCLRREPYDVLTANDPQEALALLDKQEFAVVVADQRMPGVTGAELLAGVRQRQPHSIRMILTGQSDLQSAIEAINEGEVYRYLAKPWDDIEFRATIRQAVNRFDLMANNRRLYELTRRQNQELDALNAQLKDAMTDAVGLLTAVLDKRSSTVGAHSTRVAGLSRRIAEAMRLSDQEIWDVTIGASLHDIGKAVLSDRVLRQTTGAVPAPRVVQDIMRQHPVVGAELVQRVRLFERAALIVRHHHECCDGSGHPEGLVRNKIPLGARIVGLVDAYDKLLNSINTYRSATPEQAIEKIREQIPNTFDQDVFACLEGLVLARSADDSGSIELGLRGSELEPGMVLSRDLKTSAGVLLLPQGTRLKVEHIIRLQALADAILGGIFVYRSEHVAE